MSTTSDFLPCVVVKHTALFILCVHFAGEVCSAGAVPSAKAVEEYLITAERAFRSTYLANNDHDQHRAVHDTRDAMTLLDHFVGKFGPEVNTPINWWYYTLNFASVHLSPHHAPPSTPQTPSSPKTLSSQAYFLKLQNRQASCFLNTPLVYKMIFFWGGGGKMKPVSWLN